MKKKYCRELFAITIVYIIIYSIVMSGLSKLDEIELGITKNSITGHVDYTTVYKAGNYFIGPMVNFLVFPSNYQILNATLTSTTSVYMLNINLYFLYRMVMNFHFSILVITNSNHLN